MAVQIKNITPGSVAEKNNISSNDILVSINDNPINDVLDYRFFQTESHVKLKIIENLTQQEKTVSFIKNEYEEIGFEFETYLIDVEKKCKNKCVFCFIDQLPKGMRESLYFKDDDSRLSFLFGNYITLTNLSDHEVDRIIKMHISPINVSVHTTNPSLRDKMMNNRFAGKSLEILEKFKNTGIKINCQIVCCPGINDGQELIKTLKDLKNFFPCVESISVVPVGLTKFRDGLFPLTSFSEKSSQEVLDIIERFSDDCLKEHGTRLAFAADEFYIKAQRPFPPADFYEDFSQLENGVGAASLLIDEFYLALNHTNCQIGTRKVTLACGTAIKDTIQKLFCVACNKFSNLSGQVIGIQNNFFGEKIDVSGLITGQDLIDQLSQIKNLGDQLLIPSVMLRRQGDLFLDNISIEHVKKALNIDVCTVDNNGQMLLDAMLGKNEE